MDQCAGQAELLLHAAGQLASKELAKVGHPRCSQQLLRTLLAKADRDLEQVGIKANILIDGEVFIKSEPLRHIADVRLHLFGIGDDVDAINCYVTVVRPHHTGKHAHRRGLATAIRAD